MGPFVYLIDLCIFYDWTPIIIVWSPRNLRGLADIHHDEEVGVPHFYPFFDPPDPLQCLIKVCHYYIL